MTLSAGISRLPLPGSPSSSWAIYRARTSTLLSSPQTSVLVAFWLFGLINNVLYVILLSAAQDLVGSAVPKGVVLLADVLPSFLTKLVAPYFIQRVSYATRVLIFIGLSITGMLFVATAPASASISTKLFGVVLASFSSGGGELSFLGLTHYYGTGALAAWGSGTGAAGLVGAGLYVMLTDWIQLGVRTTLLIAATLPLVMFFSFFVLLPREPLAKALGERDGYLQVSNTDESDIVDDETQTGVNTAIRGTGYSTLTSTDEGSLSRSPSARPSFEHNLARAKALVVPYMAPLLLVYIAEYSINQGVAPVLLFPLAPASPFRAYREFYPFYGFLYQLGVFISRSSTPWLRLRALYPPALLQLANLLVLVLQALLFFIPNVYVVFAIIVWEGLLGGGVYVNTFAKILDEVPLEDREFSLAATTVSDSAGICVAGLVSIVLEVNLCDWQVSQGRDWCRNIKAESFQG
ncbi:battenin CLN3 protein [Ceratocystis pirilliformis]|uniref:Protein BTN n=1 Tax=Ceratocystis pirilliformis TaxID=259994 RepID=A0ABR3ZN59_9PEZI